MERRFDTLAHCGRGRLFSRVNSRTTLIFFAIAISVVWVSYNSFGILSSQLPGITADSIRCQIFSALLSVPAMTAGLVSLTRMGQISSNRVLPFIIFFTIFICVLLSYAPGCYSEDSYHSWLMVKASNWSGWYSVVNPWLMTSIYQILPSNIAFGLALCALYSVVFSYAFQTIREIGGGILIIFVFLLLAISPSAVMGILLLSRDAFFNGFMLIYAIFLFRIFGGYQSLSLNLLFLSGLAAAFLGCYRTDALPPLALALAAQVWLLARKSARTQRRLAVAYAFVPFALLFSIFSSAPSALGSAWNRMAEQMYSLTLFENPLGYIVKGDNFLMTDRQKEKIEKVYKISDLQQHSSIGNISVFYTGHWNQDSSLAERSEALHAALEVFLLNPLRFMESRIKTLNFVGREPYPFNCSREYMAQRGYPVTSPHFGDIIVSYMYSAEKSSFIWFNASVWLVLVNFLIFFWRWVPGSSAAAALMGIRSFIVFLAAPASFVQYYGVLFIGGPILICLMYFEWRYRQRAQLVSGTVIV
jgi:hypothetical protein